MTMQQKARALVQGLGLGEGDSFVPGTTMVAYVWRCADDPGRYDITRYDLDGQVGDVIERNKLGAIAALIDHTYALAELRLPELFGTDEAGTRGADGDTHRTIFASYHNQVSGRVYYQRFTRTLAGDGTAPFAAAHYEPTGIYGPLLPHELGVLRFADADYQGDPDSIAWMQTQGWELIRTSEQGEVA